MECSDEVWVGVGIDSSKDYLIYFNHGTIQHEGEIVDEGETYKLNDKISCHCMRIRSNPSRVQATFTKNGKKVGQRILDIQDDEVKLTVVVIPKHERMMMVNIKTSQVENEYSSAYGMLVGMHYE